MKNIAKIIVSVFAITLLITICVTFHFAFWQIFLAVLVFLFMLLIYIMLRINYYTNQLRKNIKTGDPVRFYINEMAYNSRVEYVYFYGGKKMVAIRWMKEIIERPVSEIYLSF